MAHRTRLNVLVLGMLFPNTHQNDRIVDWVLPQPYKMFEFLGWVVSQHSFMRVGGCLLPSSTGNLNGQGQLFVWSLSLNHYSQVLFNSRVWPAKIEQPFWFWQFWNKTPHMWRVYGTQYLNYVWCPFYKLWSQNQFFAKSWACCTGFTNRKNVLKGPFSALLSLLSIF